MALAAAGLFSQAAAIAAPTPPFDHAEGGHVTDVPPGPVAIDVVSAHGACDADTVTVTVSEDSQEFAVAYSDFTATVGPDAEPTDFRKPCLQNLTVLPPHGFTYAVASVDYRGYASLEEGATGTQRASYSFRGSEPTNPFSLTLAGPIDHYWAVTDAPDLAVLDFAPCGETSQLRIDTELRVDAGTSDPDTTSLMALSSVDTDLETTYHLAWLECEPAKS